MIRVNQIRLEIERNETEIKNEVSKKLQISEKDIKNIIIEKKSIDARQKNKMIFFNYTILAEIENENLFLKNNSDYQKVQEETFFIPHLKNVSEFSRPVIVGSGPAGLFCALILCEAGLKPIIIERGEKIEKRVKTVESFWKNSILNEESNVQFGEGGAGTFSDGKLTTLIKDKDKIIPKVFNEFVESGAPKEILYFNKPHIGTDVLRKVVISLRNKIESLGGTYLFESKLTDIIIKNGQVEFIEINGNEKIKTDTLVLAIGHSSRDTFEMLLNKNMKISQKPFSMGVRIEHPAELINKIQYGKFFNHKSLSAADYKISTKTKDLRAVYSFCMCPGGYVIGSSSEKNSIVINGMSKNKRDNINSNSALLVNVETTDFKSNHPLAGMFLQKLIENKAFEKSLMNNYYAPVQLLSDFLNDKISTRFFNVKPSYMPGTYFEKMENILPDFIIKALKSSIDDFDKKLKGFNLKDAVLTAPETRSSSPIRIERDENFESSIKGIYPSGEGAGYAGGITSSAVDGIKTALSIIKMKGD